MMNFKKHIPSTLTLLNLICGFLAIIEADFYISSILLLIGMLFDVFDGAVARWLKVQSDLGRELDSMADMVSFVVAPAYLYYILAPGTNSITLLAPCLMVAAGGLRLAKFNLLESSKSFIGLASPASALFFIGLFLGYHYENKMVIYILDNPIFYNGIGTFFAYMMLSPLKMFSLKTISKPLIGNPYEIIVFLTFILLLVFNPSLALPLTILSYIFLSFVQFILTKYK